MFSFCLYAVVSFLLLSLLSVPFCIGIRSFPGASATDDVTSFSEAPSYRNGAACPASVVHIAKTLDFEYLCGSIATIHSVLKHASCPESVFFHFVVAEFDPSSPHVLTRFIGAPGYCHANLTNYFTDNFWADPILTRVFPTRKPCYFNTDVMVMDLDKWRSRNFRRKIESWMEVQRKTRIYKLGSLSPFLLVFAGNMEAIDHSWNQPGLDGDNVRGSCGGLHPGKVSLLHWSGKGKLWVRLEAGNACPIDHVWEPYNLYRERER